MRTAHGLGIVLCPAVPPSSGPAAEDGQIDTHRDSPWGLHDRHSTGSGGYRIAIVRKRVSFRIARGHGDTRTSPS